MIKFKETILMLCLFFSGAMCYAHATAEMENVIVVGGPTIIIHKTTHCGPDRSDVILASVSNHTLTVVFKEFLGEVMVDITTVSGEPIEGTATITPTGFQVYIPLAGDYIVTFSLPNGDEYYGEFTVTD